MGEYDADYRPTYDERVQRLEMENARFRLDNAKLQMVNAKIAAELSVATECLRLIDKAGDSLEFDDDSCDEALGRVADAMTSYHQQMDKLKGVK